MLKIPIDYTKYLKDRVIIITGVGRSGTTILGKIIGSMQNCYYLFEPAIMKYLVYHVDLFRALLFEDYLLPLVQGRNLNYNSKDDSFWQHYRNYDNISYAWKYLSRRSNAIKYIEMMKQIETMKSFWIIKTNEIADYAILKKQFSGVRFIHIVRNGLEVISSAVEKGWYTDEYMKDQIIDYVDECGVNVPWYLSEEDKLNWIEYNQITRCACVWRTLSQKAPEPYLKYEQLIESPKIWTDKIMKDFGLIATDLTWSHVETIKQYQKKEHIITFNDIQEPERERFKTTMRQFGYIQ